MGRGQRGIRQEVTQLEYYLAVYALIVVAQQL